MKKLLLAAIMSLLITSPALTHWEDVQGCNSMVESLPHMNELDQTYNGISEDGRDYIIRWKDKEGDAIFEEHHIMLPVAQWENTKTPGFLEPILSMWIDWDGNGHFGEFWLFPRTASSCNDAMHFVWDNDRQTYVLIQAGKEHI